MTKNHKISDIMYMSQSAYEASFAARGVAAFVINHNMTVLEPTVKEANAKRDEIIRKYADTEEDGVSRITGEENLKKANEEFSAYQDIEVPLDLVIIPETKLSDSNLTPQQITSIKWMIKSVSSDDFRAAFGLVDEEAEEAKKKEETKYDPKAPMNDDRF